MKPTEIVAAEIGRSAIRAELPPVPVLPALARHHADLGALSVAPSRRS